MSQYTVVETKFEDLECLGKALENMGLHPEIHPEGTQFTPTYGTGTKTAHIVVRRQNFGGMGDVGFEKKDNQIKMHCDNGDWTEGSYQKRFDLPRLRIRYNQEVLRKSIRGSARYSEINTEQLENGSERVRLRVWEF